MLQIFRKRKPEDTLKEQNKKLLEECLTDLEKFTKSLKEN